MAKEILLKKLRIYHFEDLLKQGYSLDHLYLLELIDNQYDVAGVYFRNDLKIQAMLQTLLRKGLIDDEKKKLTLAGKELLDIYEKVGKTKLPKANLTDDTAFADWWKVFPATDAFEYKGKKFDGSRGMRVRKDDCRIKFNKILATGEYTLIELIEALKLEIQMRKERSIKEWKNALSYMQNSLTYLNQSTYDNFVELYRKSGGVKEESSTNSSQTNVVDI